MTPTKNAAVPHLASDFDAYSPTPHLFDAPLRVNALRYQRNLYIAEKCI